MKILKPIYLIASLLMYPALAAGQTNLIRIETESTFATMGDYNETNKHLAFGAIDYQTNIKKIKVAIKVKNIATGDEVQVSDIFLFDSPEFGWSDSATLCYTAYKSSENNRIWGAWQGYFILYTMHTGLRDTLAFPWFSSENFVRNIYISDNKLFYTIKYGHENNEYWQMYDFNLKSTQTIMKVIDKTFVDNLITWQYSKENNSLIYVKKDRKRYQIIKRSIDTGVETVIKNIHSGNSIEHSTIKNSSFYYTEKRIKHVSEKKSFIYEINCIDINTGQTNPIYTFLPDIEVTKIDSFQEHDLLISLSGSQEENRIDKTIPLNMGGDVSISIDPTSYLYIYKQ